jgi:hypothetical protein
VSFTPSLGIADGRFVTSLAAALTSALPYLVVAEAVVVIVSGVYGFARYIRPRLRRKSDRLAHLNLLLSRPTLPSWVTLKRLRFHLNLLWWLFWVTQPLFIVSGVVAFGPVLGWFPETFYTFLFVLGFQVLFCILTVEAVRLRPVLKVGVSLSDMRKAEDRYS